MQLSPTVCKPNTKKNYEQMEIDEIDGKINDKEIVLDLLKVSTLPLLYLTGDIQKDIAFYRRTTKINGMASAWDVLMLVTGKYP